MTQTVNRYGPGFGHRDDPSDSGSNVVTSESIVSASVPAECIDGGPPDTAEAYCAALAVLPLAMYADEDTTEIRKTFAMQILAIMGIQDYMLSHPEISKGTVSRLREAYELPILDLIFFDLIDPRQPSD